MDTQLQAEARASWEKKTPQQKRDSVRRLDTEIGEKAASALEKAFVKAFKKLYGEAA